MGIGKSILGYTTFESYNPEIDSFIKLLSEKLPVNFIVNTYDADYNLMHEENKILDFSKNETYQLIIEYILNEDDSINENPQYRLKIPIRNFWENALELVFYPNNILEVHYLTFEHLWITFINTLKFKYSETDRQYALKRYHVLRNMYLSLLTKLGIAELLIVSHAYYAVEYLMEKETDNGLQFSDILKVAKTEDKLHIFDLQDLLKAETIDILSYEFLNKSDLEIALVDFLNL